MKKTLEKIRSKSAETRMTIAFVLALVITLIIGAGWVMTLPTGGRIKNKIPPPSPFSALAGTIKDAVDHSKNTPQIIDAGTLDTVYDESNPYQAPVTPTATQSTAQ